MPNAPTARALRNTIGSRLAASQLDPIEFESLKADVIECVRFVRRDLDRAFEFAGHELTSELLSVVEDHPDLVHETDALVELAATVPGVHGMLSGVDAVAVGARLPDRDERDRLATLSAIDRRTAELSDALRVAVLRREPLAARIRILRRLRDAEPRKRTWLDQLERHEQDFLREIADMRSRPVSREMLDQAIALIDGHNWVTHVPRGLRDELVAKVRPLRAAEADERYRALVDEIHAAAGLMDRQALLELEAKWAEVQDATGHMPSPELQSMVMPTFDWLTEQANEEAAAAEHAVRIEALERALTESAPPEVVSRHLAQVVDGGRPAPEGLVARARAVLLAEEERRRRRGRFIVFASIAAAAVLCIVGFAAIRSYGRADQTEREIAQLEQLLEGNEPGRAHALAEQIRMRGSVEDARLAALLAREAEIHVRRVARAEEIREIIARLEKELGAEGAGVSRARLDAIGAELAAIAKEAETTDGTAIGSLRRIRSEAIERLDASQARLADEAIAATTRTLRMWPPPTGWTDAEQLDAGRWIEYARALESQRDALEAQLAQLAGYEPGQRRIRTELDGVNARIEEAQSRGDSLAAALSALDPSRLGAPFGGEGVFLDRLAKALGSHGAILARQGQLAEFEAAQDLGEAWLAIGAWRDGYRPRLTALLGRNLDGNIAPDSAKQVLAIVREFLASHPKSPNRAAIERFARNFDDASPRERSDPQAIAERLAEPRYAEMETVRIRGGRHFYRRPDDPDERDEAKRNTLYRSLKTRTDLLSDPTKLTSMHFFQRSEIESAPVIDPVSAAWGRAHELMTTARPGEETAILLDAVKSIADASESDPLFRLVALRDAVAILLDAGNADPTIVSALSKWRDSLRTQASRALKTDWVLAAYKDPKDYAAERNEASAALRAFPGLEAALESARASRRADGDALSALAPIGVLVPPKSAGAARFVPGVSYTGPAVVVQRAGAGFSLSTVELRDGQLASGGTVRPLGPVIIYRRIQ